MTQESESRIVGYPAGRHRNVSNELVSTKRCNSPQLVRQSDNDPQYSVSRSLDSVDNDDCD